MVTKRGQPYKLANQYEGPYTIIEIVNDKGNVKIKKNNNKTKIVHVNRLRISYIDQENWEKKNDDDDIYMLIYNYFIGYFTQKLL